MEFRDWVMRELDKKGWSASKLADELHVRPPTVSRWISGEDLPSATNCDRLARVFNADRNYILQMAEHIEKTTQPEPLKTTLSSKWRSFEYDLPLEVPIVGSCGMGTFSIQEQNPEGYLLIARESVGTRKASDLFALHAHGDCLIGDNIFNGDMVVVDKKYEFIDGKIYIIQVNDECMCRHVHRRGDKGVLVASNHEYKDIEISEGQIIGRVILAGQWRTL